MSLPINGWLGSFVNLQQIDENTMSFLGGAFFKIFQQSMLLSPKELHREISKSDLQRSRWESFLSLPNLLDWPLFALFSIRQKFLQFSKSVWKVTPWWGYLFIIPALVPLFTLIVSVVCAALELVLMPLSLVISPTAWSRKPLQTFAYLAAIVGIAVGIVLGTSIIALASWLAPMVAIVVFALVKDYWDTRKNYMVVNDFLSSSSDFRASIDNEEKRNRLVEQAIQILRALGPSLGAFGLLKKDSVETEELNYKEMIVKLQEAQQAFSDPKKSDPDEAKGCLFNLFSTVNLEIKYSGGIFGAEPQKRRERFMYGIILLIGVLLTLLAVASLFFPPALPFTLPILAIGVKWLSTSMLAFVVGSFLVMAGAQRCIILECKYSANEQYYNSFRKESELSTSEEDKGVDNTSTHDAKPKVKKTVRRDICESPKPGRYVTIQPLTDPEVLNQKLPAVVSSPSTENLCQGSSTLSWLHGAPKGESKLRYRSPSGESLDPPSQNRQTQDDGGLDNMERDGSNDSFKVLNDKTEESSDEGDDNLNPGGARQQV